jgi:hypothetical protein
MFDNALMSVSDMPFWLQMVGFLGASFWLLIRRFHESFLVSLYSVFFLIGLVLMLLGDYADIYQVHQLGALLTLCASGILSLIVCWYALTLLWSTRHTE